MAKKLETKYVFACPINKLVLKDILKNTAIETKSNVSCDLDEMIKFDCRGKESNYFNMSPGNFTKKDDSYSIDFLIKIDRNDRLLFKSIDFKIVDIKEFRQYDYVKELLTSIDKNYKT